jgi:tetratricopeptide (TPR) repeat protein
MWQRSLFCALVLMLCCLVHASEPSGQSAEDIQPLESLNTGNYLALEQFYSEQQRAFEAGTISDETLFAAFRKLDVRSPDGARAFDGWVSAFPKSYAALLARGTYEYHMALAARGDNYIRDTTQPKLDAMSNWLRRAQSDLDASLQLTPKPYLSVVYLLDLSMLSGTPEERQHWFEVALKMDPVATHVRHRYMFSLRPRWGGSYTQMQEFLQQCKSQGLPPKLIASLEILIHADLAEDAMSAGDQAQVLNEWGQVLSLSDLAEEAPSDEALIGYARAAQDLGRPADAERAIKQLQGRTFQDAWSLSRVGYIYVRAHHDAEAWPILQRAAELDDAWSQYLVGANLYNGMPSLKISAQPAEGLLWIKRSAQQCHPEALRFLAAHGQGQMAGCQDPDFKVPRELLAWGSAATWRSAGTLVCCGLVVLLLLSRARARVDETRDGSPSPDR